MSEEQQISEQEITNIKKAHLRGWLVQSTLAGQSVEDAHNSFKQNDERCDKYMQKLAKVRETIKAQAEALAE